MIKNLNLLPENPTELTPSRLSITSRRQSSTTTKHPDGQKPEDKLPFLSSSQPQSIFEAQIKSKQTQQKQLDIFKSQKVVLNHTEPTPNFSLIFSTSAACPSKAKPFTISNLGFGTIEQQGCVGGGQNPWWIAHKLSKATRKENEHLTAVLARLDLERLKGLAARGMFDHSVGDGEDGGHRNIDKNGGGLFEGKNGTSVFDRNFWEIMKLLEKVKNSDDRAQSSENISSNLTENDTTTTTKKRKGNNTNDKSDQDTFQQTGAFFDNSGGGAMNNILGKSSDVGGVMRKPLRLIYLELARRIEGLKNSQSEWEAFQNKIALYKLEDEKSRPINLINLIKLNKDLTQTYTPTSRLQKTLTQTTQHKEHQLMVIEKHTQIQASKLKHVLATIQKKDLSDSAKTQLKNPIEKLGKTQLLQKRWFMVIGLASRLYTMREFLINRHKERMIYLTENHAARLIQHTWKNYKFMIREEQIRSAFHIIGRVFKRYIAWRREIALNKAADNIRQFLKDVQDVSKLMKIVKKYRYSVVRAQMFSRSFLIIKYMRLRLIERYWDKLVPLWWQHRKPGGNTEDSSTKRKAKDSKKSGKGGKESEKIVVKISDHIRQQVVKEDYSERRKVYFRANAAYLSAQKTKLLLNNTTKDENDNAKPVFQTFVPQNEMIALIERGFLIQAQQQKITR